MPVKAIDVAPISNAKNYLDYLPQSQLVKIPVDRPQPDREIAVLIGLRNPVDRPKPSRCQLPH